jgi:hypothetical protein
MQEDAFVPTQSSNTPGVGGDASAEDRESSLQRIRERLYSQKPPELVVPPSLTHTAGSYPPVLDLSVEEARAEAQYQSWTPPSASAMVPPHVPVQEHAGTTVSEPPRKKKLSFTFLFLAVSILFFIVAGGVSFLVFWHGGLSVSSNNIQITIQGPTTLSSGATVPLQITVKNNNPASISNTDIAIVFPDGTRSADDVTQPLLRYADTLGTIPAGGSVSRTVNAVLFGSVNQSIDLPVTIEYNTANSNALFTKEQDFHTLITSSPLTITAQAASTTSSGQLYTIMLTVHSNATQVLQNIAVNAQYPEGFTLVGAALDDSATQLSSKTSGEPVYVLDTLQPGDDHIITITGTLTGNPGDQKAFNFTVGTQNTDTQQLGLAVAYASQSITATLAKPFLDVSLSLNHSDSDPTVVSAGSSVSGLATWINTLTSSLSNAQVLIKLSGNALDTSKVVTTNGFYQSSSNTLLYTAQTDSNLAQLGAGDTDNGLFTLAVLPESAILTLRNPTIVLTVAVSGQPEGEIPMTLTNILTKTIKVQTDLKLISQLVHSSGPFKNAGPWPPIANQTTTYTVELAVGNTVNDVAGATATMILPPYVTYTGQATPDDGSVSYDAASRTVTWRIGTVPAGTTTHPLTAAFQVSFTPSISQVGTSPTLIGNQTLTGTDRFTGTTVGNTAEALTTQTTGDPGYQPTFGIVTQ